MFSYRRFENAYKTARKIGFDDSRPLVFMSDVHRGDNSIGDEFGQNKLIYYHALQYYYEDGFTYVEVGDGDELWETPNYKYIRSAHPEIFELLRKFLEEDRLIMLYGNHNSQIKRREYVEKNMSSDYDDFLGTDVDILPGIRPCGSLILRYVRTGQEIFVMHGHQGEIFNDYLSPFAMFIVKYIWRFVHRLGFKYAASPARNRFKRAGEEKKLIKWIRDKNFLLICGHTHRPRLSQPSEGRYFNCGCCIHPRGITSIEVVYGEIALVHWTVHTRRDGMVYVKRNTIKGPENIADYMNVQPEDENRE